MHENEFWNKKIIEPLKLVVLPVIVFLLFPYSPWTGIFPSRGAEGGCFFNDSIFLSQFTKSDSIKQFHV